jgi:hypothetical protein
MMFAGTVAGIGRVRNVHLDSHYALNDGNE